MTSVPNSPILGQDGITSDAGKEIRRARFAVEITYGCQPGEHIDIQAQVYDALADAGVESDGQAGGPVLLAVDLLEHTILDQQRPAAP